MKKIAIFHWEDLSQKHVSSVGLYIKNFLDNKSKFYQFSYFGCNGRGATCQLKYRKKVFGLLPISFQFFFDLLKKRKKFLGLDAVWFHQIYYASTLLWLKNRPKIFLTIHGRRGSHTFPFRKNALKSWLVKIAERMAVSLCDKIFLLNLPDLNYYHKHYRSYRKKFIYTPNFYQKNTFFPRNKLRVKKAIGFSGKVIFIYTGRLALSKQICLSLKIFAKYNQKNSASVFLIIGSGERENKLKNLTKKFNLEKKVIFFPWMSQNDLAKFYQASDIFLSCSLFEGMSLSMLEAMACKVPVVALFSPELKELIIDNKNGFLFDFKRESIEKVVQKIEELVASKEMPESTYKFVRQFSSRQAMPAILKLFD
ncbi:MAG: 1,2-diacylglycerol 3-glucosyltransferase [Candidatus Berkelbacteria bacterium Licking1014_7]|uniref:1,2-diacylglycerol 3-glucosyltransferase n=1 Tax=Candidatus Berkelbacteria bacterium Licking1014_7 TaxID=2017147 RepID=A0A554LJP8_9BACT|nr:MAG: 1,2-diacylglycerol 3-glucosyltransferase [Candidatus Berkelbacteria bacterium Licking1014_7]